MKPQNGAGALARAPAPRAVQRAVLGAVLALAALQLLSGPPARSVPADASPTHVRLRIDPNAAGRHDLMLLPGIGPAMADYIIEYRESCDAAPAFARAEDLGRVHRIGPRTVEKLRPHLCFEHNPHISKAD